MFSGFNDDPLMYFKSYFLGYIKTHAKYGQKFSPEDPIILAFWSLCEREGRRFTDEEKNEIFLGLAAFDRIM